jgi:hypothetical protein
MEYNICPDCYGKLYLIGYLMGWAWFRCGTCGMKHCFAIEDNDDGGYHPIR